MPAVNTRDSRLRCCTAALALAGHARAGVAARTVMLYVTFLCTPVRDPGSCIRASIAPSETHAAASCRLVRVLAGSASSSARSVGWKCSFISKSTTSVYGVAEVRMTRRSDWPSLAPRSRKTRRSPHPGLPSLAATLAPSPPARAHHMREHTACAIRAASFSALKKVFIRRNLPRRRRVGLTPGRVPAAPAQSHSLCALHCGWLNSRATTSRHSPGISGAPPMAFRAPAAKSPTVCAAFDTSRFLVVSSPSTPTGPRA